MSGLDRYARSWLSEQFGSSVRFDEPMARHTSFRIGGPADAWVEVTDEIRLRQLLQWIDGQHLPYLIIGGGTNLLVRDGGFRGVVIHLGRPTEPPSWTVSGDTVSLHASAGIALRQLCALALRNGWQGLNFALGIPGTLGGALAMNAGTGLGCIADPLQRVTVLTGQGRRHIVERSAMQAGYRRLCLPRQIGDTTIFWEAEVALRLGERQRIQLEARQIVSERARRQPVRSHGAGCFFKNPMGQPAAGRLIEQAGLKGVLHGQAQVSPLHANFIVNVGQASALDVLALAERVQTTVWRRNRVWLEPEVRIVGESPSTQSA